MASAKILNEALDPIVKAGKPLTLDVDNLTFIDSSGLRALVQLSTQMNGVGPLVLSHPPKGVRRLLEIVGLDALPGIAVQNDVA